MIGLPLNFANIVALPLLLGIGVAFKIYYVVAWRSGRTNLLQIEPDARDLFQRADDRHRIWQPLALQPSRHREHGQAACAIAAHHARGRAVFQPALMGKPRDVGE